ETILLVLAHTNHEAVCMQRALSMGSHLSRFTVCLLYRKPGAVGCREWPISTCETSPCPADPVTVSRRGCHGGCCIAGAAGPPAPHADPIGSGQRPPGLARSRCDARERRVPWTWGMGRPHG